MTLRQSAEESRERRQSMKELIHEQPFSVEGRCPNPVEFKRLPTVTPKRSLERRLSRGFQSEEFILPDINCRERPGPCEEENWDKLVLPYGPYKFFTEDENRKFKVAGPSLCETNFDCEFEIAPEVVIKLPEEKLEESNALKRWEYWMKDKRRMQEYLSRRLKRSTWHLRLQDSDKIRKRLEEKWLHDYTQIPVADKWRGHPYRWKAQLRLFDNKMKWDGEKSYDPPEYCAVKTGVENGEIPEMEFIGIPNTIQKEKGLVYKQSKTVQDPLDKLRLEDARYLRRRRKKLKPHHIVMDNLEVIGRKIFQENEDLKETPPKAELPKIRVSEVNTSTQSEEESDSVFCLAIGNENNEIKYSLRGGSYQVPSETYAFQVHFGVNSVGSVTESALKVENRGTMAVAYRWISKKPQKSWNLEKLQPKEYEPCFFFNKNSGFFLPGQICYLKFYHYSQYSGVRKEVWYLETEPPLSKNPDSCTVSLSAITTNCQSCDGIHPLETYINNRVKESIVTCMLEIILWKTFRPNLRGIEYRSIFSWKLQFECNNPKYYYNAKIVRELNEIYEEITEKRKGEWDLCVDTLVRLVNETKAGSEKISILSQITEKALVLLKPTYTSTEGNKKYRMTYGILCNMMNCIEEDYDYFRQIIRRIIRPPFPQGSEEMGEFEYHNILGMVTTKPISFMFCKTLLYIKVYYRLCDAVEHIAGVLETAKLFEPWKKADYLAIKPPRKPQPRKQPNNLKV